MHQIVLSVPLIRRTGGILSHAQIVGQARAFAATLPEGGRPINLCQSRSRFLTALLAASLRGQQSLLPNDRTLRTLRALRDVYGAVYCLVDEASDAVESFDCRAVPDEEACSDASNELWEFAPEQTAAAVFTSGSTGMPVPYPKTWRALVAEASELARRFDVKPGSAIVATVPPQHMFGLAASVMLPLVAGASVWSGRPFYPADIVAALAAVPAPRILVTTPLHLRSLVSARSSMPAVDFILSATAPLGAAFAASAERTLKTRVVEIYGCTEVGAVGTRRTATRDDWQLLGDFALYGSEDSTIVRGSYLPQPVLLADRIERITARSFRLHGRSGDMINIAGKRGSLAGLRSILCEVEGVEDAVLMLTSGNQHDVARLNAFVVAPTQDVERIRAALRSRIDPVFMPRHIFLVSALPRNETGKLTEAALQAWAGAMLGTGRDG